MADLLEALQQAFAGSRLTSRDGVISGPVVVDHEFFTVRIRQAPAYEVFFSLPASQGFFANAEYAVRFWDQPHFAVNSNDDVLESWFFDESTHREFAAAIARHHEFGKRKKAKLAQELQSWNQVPARYEPVVLDGAAWRVECSHDKVTLRPTFTPELPMDMVHAINLGAAVAGGPLRVTREFAKTIVLPGEVIERADRIALGEPAVSLVERGVHYHVTFARTPMLPDSDEGLHVVLAATPTSAVSTQDVDLAGLRKSLRSQGIKLANAFCWHQGQLCIAHAWRKSRLPDAATLGAIVTAMVNAVSGQRLQGPYR